MYRQHQNNKRNKSIVKMLLIATVMTLGFAKLWTWKNDHIAERVRVSQIETINLVKLNAKEFNLDYYRTAEHYQQAKINN